MSTSTRYPVEKQIAYINLALYITRSEDIMAKAACLHAF